MSSTIDISQISEYLTAKHIGLLVALIIVISLVFGKKRPKNAPPTAHVGLPVIGIVIITITIIYNNNYYYYYYYYQYYY